MKRSVYMFFTVYRLVDLASFLLRIAHSVLNVLIYYMLLLRF